MSEGGRPAAVSASIWLMAVSSVWGWPFAATHKGALIARGHISAVIVFGMVRGHLWGFQFAMVFASFSAIGWLVWLVTEARGVAPAWSIGAFVLGLTTIVLLRRSEVKAYALGPKSGAQ